MSLQEKYDVFLSFRGQDTRDGFTSHLYGGLRSKQITTYIDNEDLEKGDVIKPELLRAIEGSVIVIVILSKNYAQSVWCLDELLHISKSSKYVIPVFYGGVKPFHVRRQMDSFGNALVKHQTRYGKEKVDAWRSCLSKIADLSGYDSEEIRPDRKLVEEIVQLVLKKLKRVTPSNPSLQGLFGIEDRVKHIIKGLMSNDTDSKDKPCQILGIWGMPGVGKSTLASVVFSQLYSEFEGSCYLDNVRVKFEKHGSTKYLLEKLVSKLLEDRTLRIETPFLDSHVKARLKRKCVLIVLDDVSDPKQIDFLVGERKKLFGHGSKIIITTRDKKVLNHIEVDQFEQLKGLQPRSRDAHQLFASHAFNGLDPPDKEFGKLIEMALGYANGVPLAIKLLGSLLHKRTKREWQDTLDKLKKESHVEIQKVLGISYEELDDTEKKIFLDIACFFKGKQRNIVENVLQGCGFYPSIGIGALIDKSLIICDSDDKKLEMHDLNQDMGRDIVRKQFKGSRLWSEDEIFDVFQNDKGSESIQSIYLENEKSSKIESIRLSPKVFLKMSNLRLLRIGCKVKLPKGLEYLPNSLRYLNWDEYPLTSLPSDFVPKHLVKLKLSNSRIERLWDNNVQISETREDEEEEEELSSPFKHLEQLVGLDLEDCKYLKDLPLTRYEWKSLEELNLSGCTSLSKVQVPFKVTWLNLSGTAIDEALESLFLALSSLKYLNLSNCKGLKSLPTSFSKSKCLEEFYVDGCPELKKFPEILEPMECLRILDISRTGIRRLPTSIENLVGLCRLVMNRCNGMVEIPPLANGITHLDLSNCERLVIIKRLPSALRSLYLQNCKKLKSLPDLPTSIRFLLADGCFSLTHVPSESVILDSNHEDIVNFFSQSSYSCEHFSFVNCQNLTSEVNNLIVYIALFRIWRKALKVLQYYEGRLPPSKSSLLTGQTVDTSTSSIMVCLPGSELPEWFPFPIEFQTNNHEGYSSVIIELQSDWYRQEFMGFVLCVVASTDHDNTENSSDTKLDFHIQFDYCFRANNGESLQGVPDFISMSDLHLSSVDHIFIGFEFGASYDAVKFARQGRVINQVSFNFSLVSASTSEPLNQCKISKCGIGVIYGPEFLMDLIDVKDRTRAPDPEVVEKGEEGPSQYSHDQSVTTSDRTLPPGNANNIQASSYSSEDEQQVAPADKLGQVGKWLISNKIADNLKILVERDPDFLVAVDKLVDFQATCCLAVVGDVLMLLSSKTLHALNDEDRAFLKATIPLLQNRNVYTPFLQRLIGQCIEGDTHTLLEEEQRIKSDLRGIRKQKAQLQSRLAEISSICSHRWDEIIFPPPL